MQTENTIICNMCGKEISMELEMTKEEMLHIEKNWGYFSQKDGEIHSLDLCEECYDSLIKRLRHPVQIKEATELI